MSLLTVTNLTKRFGGLVANSGVDLTVGKSQIVGLIGPNGAGKTTLFNCIAGYYAPDEGEILLDGVPIAGQPPEKVCSQGIARTFQLVKVFRSMTVLENVMTGAFLHHPRTADARAKALEVLDFIGIMDKRDLTCDSLPLPDKKMVEVARAMATSPKLLPLDEALAGLSGEEMHDAVRLIARIAKEGIAILVVEHVMEVIMPISEKVVVLDHGIKIAEDKPEIVTKDPRVIEAYLGKSYGEKQC